MSTDPVSPLVTFHMNLSVLTSFTPTRGEGIGDVLGVPAGAGDGVVVDPVPFVTPPLPPLFLDAGVLAGDVPDVCRGFRYFF